VLYDPAADQLYQSRRWQVRVTDRVGGGDSFCAALIHALLRGREPGPALQFATAASALKLTIPGDFNRVTADEVDALLARTS
jgi:2-dehydro-3-deoxygluconokinase